MSFYKVSYEQLRQAPEIAEMLSALERGFEKFGIDFYLVGAVARDVWMRGIHKIAPNRTTGDIDFAVLINDKGIFESLKDYLIATGEFAPVKNNDYVFIWKTRLEVDLLPFGAIEDADGQVTTKGQGFTTISLQGFSEIYAGGLPELELEEKHRFKFCTLPGLVLLKLIAWDDRPEIRRDDVKDISNILHHFFDMYDNEIYSNHHDLFADENVNLKHIAARVMGREMRKITKRNEKLLLRVLKILEANTVDIRESKIATIMISDIENTVEENVSLLRQLKLGLIE